VLGEAAVTVGRGIGLPIPAVFDPKSLVSLEDRAIAHLIAGSLVNWAEQVKHNNTEFVKQGNEIPGFKYISKSTGVKVPRDETVSAADTIRASGYASDGEVLASCTLSLTELAKGMVEVRGSTLGEEKDRLKELLKDHTTEARATFLQKIKNFSFKDMAMLPALPAKKGGKAKKK